MLSDHSSIIALKRPWTQCSLNLKGNFIIHVRPLAQSHVAYPSPVKIYKNNDIHQLHTRGIESHFIV